MMSGRAMAMLAVLVGMTAAAGARAAPYCVSVQGLPDQCIYADGQDCQKRATQLGGVCAANPAAVIAQSGPGHFCLLVGGQASLCIYPDRATCQSEAARHRTACVEAATAPQEGVDPYAIRRPY